MTEYMRWHITSEISWARHYWKSRSLQYLRI